jgi:peptidyl-prolyl cis-trans isomerase SurA
MQRQPYLAKIALLSLVGCILGAPSLYSQLSLGGGGQAPQPQPPSQPQQDDKDRQDILNAVVAIVNDDVITLDQVRELTNSQEDALSKTYEGQPDELRKKIYDLREQAVKELVDRQLILQEFKKMEAKGANIPDYVLEDHIQTIIRGSFNGDRAAFIRTLDAQGLTLAKYRENERDKIIVSAMRQRQIKTDIMIPPRDIEEYYAQHRAEYSDPDMVHLRMISLSKEGATDATKKALAEEIRQKVAAGADFGNMAQLYSETHNGPEEKGDWGWITRNDVNKQLTQVAFSLKPGQVSNIVDSEGSYWLLFVEEKKNGGSQPFKAVRDDIEKKLLQVEQQQEQEQWLAGLRQKAYIKTF